MVGRFIPASRCISSILQRGCFHTIACWNCPAIQTNTKSDNSILSCRTAARVNAAVRNRESFVCLARMPAEGRRSGGLSERLKSALLQVIHLRSFRPPPYAEFQPYSYFLSKGDLCGPGPNEKARERLLRRSRCTSLRFGQERQAANLLRTNRNSIIQVQVFTLKRLIL